MCLHGLARSGFHCRDIFVTVTMFQNLRGSALTWAITLSSGSCYVLFGYDQGVLGGLVAQPSFLDAIGNPSAGYLGTIVSLPDLEQFGRTWLLYYQFSTRGHFS